MPNHSDISNDNNKSADVQLIDGTGSQQSYAVVARRGNIFLGIKFAGLADGASFGLPGTTYVHVRLRSARSKHLAAQLDVTRKDKIFNLPLDHLSLDEAWPYLSFEKVDEKRASLGIGLFIKGSLIVNTDAVISRIEKGDLFRKLIVYVMSQVDPKNCIVDQHRMSLWLADQAQSVLNELKKKIAIQQMIASVHNEFGTTFGGQFEMVAPHTQVFNSIYQKHLKTHTPIGKPGYNATDS